MAFPDLENHDFVAQGGVGRAAVRDPRQPLWAAHPRQLKHPFGNCEREGFISSGPRTASYRRARRTYAGCTGGIQPGADKHSNGSTRN